MKQTFGFSATLTLLKGLIVQTLHFVKDSIHFLYLPSTSKFLLHKLLSLREAQGSFTRDEHLHKQIAYNTDVF